MSDGTRSSEHAPAPSESQSPARAVGAPQVAGDVGNMAIAQYARGGGSLTGFAGAAGSNQESNHARQPFVGRIAPASGADAVQLARSDTRVELPHRSSAERALGHDLGGVDAYVGPAAAQACDALGADAMTFGGTVAFKHAQPAPATVVHEATHVIQQGFGATRSTAAVPDRLSPLPASDAAEHAARASETGSAKLERGATPAPAPALALKLAEHSAAQTGHVVHLLPSLGSPTKLATLPAGMLVAVTEVLAGGLAYRVYVPALGLTGIVPKNSIVEMPGLQHVEGAEFTRDVSADEPPESLDELAKQKPELGFLAWSPGEQAPGEQAPGEQAPAEQAPPGPKPEAMSRKDIIESWTKRSADLLQAASDPANKLSADQMYQIWLTHYTTQFNAAVDDMKRVELETRERLGAGEYSRLEYEYEKLHKRDVFGPEYRAAADRLAMLQFITMYTPEVREWLETQIDSLSKHPTLDETTAKAIEITQAHHNFDATFGPIVYGALGGGLGRTPAPPEGTYPAPRTPAGPFTKLRRDIAARTAAVQIELEEIGAAPNTGGRSAAAARPPAAMVDEAPAAAGPRPLPPRPSMPSAAPRPAPAAKPGVATAAEPTNPATIAGERVAPAIAAPAVKAPPKLAAVRQWAAELANSNPNKMSPEEMAKDRAEYAQRTQTVKGMYGQAMAGEIPTPSGVSKERLTQAVKGGADGQRVPLNFGTDPVKAKELFERFKRELQAVFDSEGITDAVVVQLGSGTTGWSTAPKKTGKAWTPKSDVDFAIFSDQALAQAQAKGAKINPKNQQGGQYTTLKNTGGFHETSLGKKLAKLQDDWNMEIYKTTQVDGFDFKLNLQSDHPFRNAVPVLQMEAPVPLTSAGASGGTRAIEVQGRAPYFGVPVQAPQMAGRLPVKSVGRREFHITVLSPPELAALPPDVRAKIVNGVEIPGAPRGRGMDRKDIGDTPNFQMSVEWPEAQEFRKSLGLPPRDLHVSLNGGIGKAIEARNAKTAADAAPDPAGDE